MTHSVIFESHCSDKKSLSYIAKNLSASVISTGPASVRSEEVPVGMLC